MTDTKHWDALRAAGDVQPPTPEVLAHAAQRVEAARDTRRRTARRRVVVPVLAAIATATVIGVVALQQPGTPTAVPVAPATTPSAPTTAYPPSKPLDNPSVSHSCVAGIELRNQEFGFDGTVVSAKPIPRTAFFWAVTFQVNEWYRPGRGPKQVTVRMIGGPDSRMQVSVQTSYRIGDRLLMAGSLVDSRTGKALPYPIGGSCGLGRTYDVPTADTWRKAFRK